jgi:hypothetical protein
MKPTLSQQAAQLVNALPPMGKWKSPFVVEHAIFGKISGTLDELGVTWTWTTLSGSEQTIFDADRPYMGVEALKFCLDQMADRQQDLKGFINRIKDALFAVYE